MNTPSFYSLNNVSSKLIYIVRSFHINPSVLAIKSPEKTGGWLKKVIQISLEKRKIELPPSVDDADERKLRRLVEESSSQENEKRVNTDNIFCADEKALPNAINISFFKGSCSSPSPISTQK